MATVKDPAFDGLRLRLMQPAIGENRWATKPIAVIDTVGAREGDVVIWISAREATLAATERVVPTDAAIIGIVDHLEPA